MLEERLYLAMRQTLEHVPGSDSLAALQAAAAPLMGGGRMAKTAACAIACAMAGQSRGEAAGGAGFGRGKGDTVSSILYGILYIGLYI